jgi:hypothetical protein
MNESLTADDLLAQLARLRDQRGLVDEQIREVLKRMPDGVELRPMWGPCTRCEHTWRGFISFSPPRNCPNCGSVGWRVQPVRSTARRPSDPPNPNWKRNRKTGLPRDPENVLGRKDRMRRQVQDAADSLVPGWLRAQRHAERQGLPKIVELAPPPKMAEVAPSLLASSLVATPDVRFAEPSAAAIPNIYSSVPDIEVHGIAESAYVPPQVDYSISRSVAPGGTSSPNIEISEMLEELRNDDGAAQDEEDPQPQ